MPESDFANDLGPAFQARPSSIQTVGGEYRGQFRSGGVDARVMADTTIHDALLAARLVTEPQWQAADRLYALWVGGGFARASTASYGQRAGGRSLDDDEATSADEYRAILRAMPMAVAAYVDTLMMLEYRPANLPGIKQALDWCVREWGL